MSLQQRKSKANKLTKGLIYPKHHPLFAELAQKYCKSTTSQSTNIDQSAQSSACDALVQETLALQTTNIEQTPRSNQLDDISIAKRLRSRDIKLIRASNPNYFITFSMKPCFDNDWSRYDRDFQVAKLSKRVSVLVYKLFTILDPKLKDTLYINWPFFFATMEHFDNEGNLVAPHMHILLKANADQDTILTIVKSLWKQAVEDAGETGVDVQAVDPSHIRDRAAYILKDAHQDGFEVLENGVRPDKLCRRFQWSADAVAHDRWRLTRDTIHLLANAHYPALKAANAHRKMNAALNSIFSAESEIYRENKRRYCRSLGLLKQRIDK